MEAMQTTIYYKEEDEYLIDKVAEKAERERKSKSAVILTILEQYFEGDETPAQILCDKDIITKEELEGNEDLSTGEELKKEFSDVSDAEIEAAITLSNKA